MSTCKPYLEFIRYSLNPKGETPNDVAKMDWEGFFQFADEQGILGLMYDGRRLMAEGVGMRDAEGFIDDLTLEWGFVVQQIEEQNKAVNVAAAKLLRSLRKRGFEGCILKGQGSSMLYPMPYRRMPGDIDVWVKMADGRSHTDRTDLTEIIQLVKERNPEARAIYHHVDGGEIEGIDVEFHYRPSFMNNPIYNHRLQKWFEEKADEQFGHEAELPDGAGEICVPTMDFNTVYLLAHVYHHLLHEGIGLRQIIDYFYLLRQSNDIRQNNKLTEIRETLQSLGLWKIAGAMMWVLSEVLGLEEKYLIAPKNERLGKVLLVEILNGGNFGQYDLDNIKADSQLKKNWQRIRRDIRMMRYFPSECLWEPVFRVYHFFWRLRYN